MQHQPLSIMVIFKKVGDLQAYLSDKNKSHSGVNFVPTMGALHQGHLSLIQLAKQHSGITVCSVFVNPTQFNNAIDFEKYPITIAEDIALLTDAGCDVLFLPSQQEIYPDGTDKAPSFDFGYLETILEGVHRPGHFKGVGQVVARLLDIVKPECLFLGQKDYQQCMVIKMLLEKLKLDSKIQLITAPTIREDDGLAMSSRNRRLTPSQRTIASTIYQCLVSIQAKLQTEKFEVVQKECIDLLKDKGFAPEYVSLANATTLSLMDDYNIDVPMVALIAAEIGGVRLIDNMVLNPVQ